MPDLHDYIAQRRDVSMAEAPLCDIDLLIFSRMAYAPMECALTADMRPQLTLAEAAHRVLTCAGKLGSEYSCYLMEDSVLLAEMRDSRRFGELGVGGFVNVIDLNKEEQFSAVTVFLPEGDAVVAIRGTDSTLVGWKENLNLAVSEAVPAQLDAVKYIAEAAGTATGELYVAGHSKGGNLAMYGAAFSAPEVKRRLAMVRSFDGPGFQKKLTESAEFADIAPVSKTVLPVSSVVGMLLEHAEDFAVVDSRSAGILQHSPYRWLVKNGDFVYVEERTNSSKFVDATMTAWIDSMTMEQREKMVDGLYYMATASDERTLRDLIRAGSMKAAVKAMKSMEPGTRDIMEQTFGILMRSAKGALFSMLERATPDKPVSARGRRGTRKPPQETQ